MYTMQTYCSHGAPYNTRDLIASQWAKSESILCVWTTRETRKEIFRTSWKRCLHWQIIWILFNECSMAHLLQPSHIFRWWHLEIISPVLSYEWNENETPMKTKTTKKKIKRKNYADMKAKNQLLTIKKNINQHWNVYQEQIWNTFSNDAVKNISYEPSQWF